jgi:hypothetical protein
MSSVRLVGVFLAALATSACVDSGALQPAQFSPVWTAKNVEGYVETAAGLRPEQQLGWDLLVAGELVRWRECVAPDTCTTVERTRPTRDLIALDTVGQATIDGREVDVLRLSLTARPRYVVPARPAR